MTALSILDPGPLQLMGDALTTRLKLVFPPARFQHDIVPAHLNAKEWRRLTHRTPFIGLGWNDIEANPEGGRPFDGHARWTVFLVTKNARGTHERYWGDALAPGLFAMVHAAIAVLNGYTIPDIGTAEATRSANLYAEGWDDDAMAMASIDLSVGISFGLADILSAPADMGLFHTLGISWDFPPSAATSQGPILTNTGDAGLEDTNTIGTAP